MAETSYRRYKTAQPQAVGCHLPHWGWGGRGPDRLGAFPGVEVGPQVVGESWRQDGSWSQASGPDPSTRPSARGTLWVYVAGKAGDTGGLWAARPPRLSLPLLHGLLRSPQGLPSPISPPSADRHRISRPWGIQLPHSQLLSNSRSDWSSSSLVTSPGPIIRAQGGQGLGGAQLGHHGLLGSP